MRFSHPATILLLAACAQAFSPGFVGKTKATHPLFSEDTHISKDFTASSGMTEFHIPTMIDNLSADNFDASLEMMEPLLVNECVGEEYDTFMSKLTQKTKEIGKELPKGYAPTHH